MQFLQAQLKLQLVGTIHTCKGEAKEGWMTTKIATEIL